MPIFLYYGPEDKVSNPLEKSPRNARKKGPKEPITRPTSSGMDPGFQARGRR